MNPDISHRGEKVVLKKLLYKAAIRRELIETNTAHRKLGKTSALIEFARENQLTVVVYDYNTAQELDWLYPSVEIYSDNQAALFAHKRFVVVDEFVDIEKLERYGMTIVTGFLHNNVH
ncbi:hypothetical protein QB910_000065 [Dabrowskivirus KKP3916]|uniref:Uncharacterized protein n=1 Tax=Alicyclobacillus phage KKP_3916 TaxID=3040651 RepID=A0AAT9V7L7_9CAUD|nr:hypothetical protein QB910_000065 [Alicyclobacillus phage KKP 3916]